MENPNETLRKAIEQLEEYDEYGENTAITLSLLEQTIHEQALLEGGSETYKYSQEDLEDAFRDWGPEGAPSDRNIAPLFRKK